MRKLLTYYMLACLTSWVIWLPLWAPALVLPHLDAALQQPLGAFGPLLGALIATAIFEGKAGLSALLRRMAMPPRRWWLIAAALLPFGIALLSAAAAQFFEGGAFGGLFQSADYPGFSPVALFLVYLFTSGVGEEPGWRGLALQELGRRFSPLVATVIVVLGWAVWHWPLFLFSPGFTAMGPGGAAGWLVSLLLGGVILTLLVELGEGALLPAMVFHAAINTGFAYTGTAQMVPIMSGVLVTLAGLAGGWMLLWRRKTSPRPVQFSLVAK